MKKKVLVLGAISPFCDLVYELQNLNFTPILCDYYEDAPAKKMGYPYFDVSTTDVDSLYKICEEQEVDGVLSAFSDRNLVPAAELCMRCDLKFLFSKNIIECLTDKKSMKEKFVENDIPVVKYGIHDVKNIYAELKEYSFPVVTKPIDAYGSKGIYLCNTYKDVYDVIDKVVEHSLKYEDRIIIEEYYQADEISVSAWVSSKRAYISCMYDVFRNVDTDFSLSGVSFPSKYTDECLEQFERLLNIIVEIMEIEDGPVTLQCFVGEKGLKVSELLCRLAGGSPYLYSTYIGGPNVAKILIQTLTGVKVDYQNLFTFIPKWNRDEVFYDVQIMMRANGRIYYDIDLNELKSEIPEIVDMRIYYRAESVIKDSASRDVLFAKVICKTGRNADYIDLITRLENIIVVYDEQEKKVSFIMVPQKINVSDTYHIDWEFMDKR